MSTTKKESIFKTTEEGKVRNNELLGETHDSRLMILFR